MFKPPPMLRQQSRQLMVSLRKDQVEMDVDELDEIDLSSILGSELDDEPILQEDKDRVREALKRGIDLREYSREVETEMNQNEKLMIADYFSEQDDFLTLYKQVSVVDGVLGTLENMLNQFHNDLKSIGSEMNSLQERSMMMSHKVNNRKLLREKLSEFNDIVTIAQDFAIRLTKGEIDDEFISCLIKLDTKKTLFNDYKSLSPTICANNEPQLNKLTEASILKIQKYLRDNLSSFKKLSDRHQVQTNLARMAYMFQFLFKYSTMAAAEVINTYVENSEKYYSNYYRNYTTGMLKLQEDVKSGNKLKQLFTTSPSDSGAAINAHTLINANTPANSRSRIEQLRVEVLESAAIEPPAAASFFETATNLANITSSQSNASILKYPFDQVYRSLVFFLIDLITQESNFVTDFFLGGEDMMTTIFAKSIALLNETTESYVNNTKDMVGLVVLIGVLDNYKQMMDKKKIYIMNQMFFERAIPLALEKFRRLFKEHSDLLISINVKELKPISPSHAHHMSKRFADVHVCLAGLHTILTSAALEANPFYKPQVELMHSAIVTLRTHSLQLLRNITNEIANKNDQVVFLVNNYADVLQSLTNDHIPDTDVTLIKFKALLNSSLAKYVSEQLTALKYFTPLMTFTHEWGPLVESNVTINPADNPTYNSDAVEQIFASIEVNWKSAVAVIKDNSTKHFASSPLAQQRAFEILLEEICRLYALMTTIVNTSFPHLKQSRHFRPQQFTSDVQSMKPSVTSTFVYPALAPSSP
ncbi:hypothetical protein SAMD00019534_008550 [Acytostelium subglobosum LB1]|uniref:hypothetical protein n=1 Tax=Acytostelium subglobosum LB1 TaxID=1410327 RepID=UPI000644A6C3|nr:hypothetical protein SAMD00019534_008550 [Acytostelium subglobosum LB1]GAM17680.1 hypothetical protein SAMD00019534_008550 [Acytostelium subglobosum LB1]|eukprot:XP_012758276.1 hypothetical protein SAMD00019534_008550 [Acytostelium subglobosum LB1]